MANDMVVMARNPQELQVAQDRLIKWADSKIKDAQIILKDSEANLEIAKKNKWRVSNWKSRTKMDREQVNYYEKIKAALEEGFCIVPDFPIEIFAIRTTKKAPKRNYKSSIYSPSHWVEDQKTNAPPKGEGDYVSVDAKQCTWQTCEENKDGKKITRYHTESDEFVLPDFPIKLVKPHILKDTTRAKTLKIFDEIGILPAQRRGTDPMVIGRIWNRRGRSEQSISFVITWWIDFRDM
jgi:hypothetical protein